MLITVPLKADEKDALRKLAERERRDPRQQAALIVVRELERAGVLPAKSTEPTQAAQAVES
jgi:hypothetical protein